MLKRILITIFILALLGLILRKSIDLNQFQKIILEYPKDQFILFLGLSFFISSIKSYRFFRLLRDSKINIDFWSSFKTYLAGSATSPLPAGELVRVSLLKKEAGISPHKTSGPVITQAYVELLSALILVIAGSLFFQVFRLPAFFSLLIVIALFLLITYEKPLKMLLEKTRNFKKIYKAVINFKKSQNQLREVFLQKSKLIPNFIFVRSLLISVGIHIIGGLLIYLIASSTGVNLNFLQSVYIYALGIVVSSIGSISPGGLGFTEGAMTAGLIFFGVNLPESIVIILIFRVVTLVFNIFLGLVFFTIFYRSLIFKH